ncbi:MAG: lipocalin family protein [Candidatus Thiodiazotropha sp.]
MKANKRKWFFCVEVGVGLRRTIIILAVAISLAGCTRLPQGIQPVDDFDLDRYLGTWYEIARLDHRFERGLDNVTAEYSLRDDGGIDVVNRGYSSGDQAWKEAQGKAYFTGDPATGHLKVSFFGPFYSAYVIFELDKSDYEYAFVCGYNRDYLWLLARRPSIDEEIIEGFLERSGSLGFDTDEIIFVPQDRAAEAVQAGQ